jgi:hypothetical protein
VTAPGGAATVSLRRYTVYEIDEMRAWISFGSPDLTNRSFAQGERESMVEDRLRTHMVNGTDPIELKRWAEHQNQIRGHAPIIL